MGSYREADGRERLALLGEIAAEVAHELHNLLQIIASSAFVARQELGAGDAPAALAHIVKVERTARLGHGIVDDLMALAGGEKLACEPALLAEMLEAARADLADSARFVDRVDPPDLKARVHTVLFCRLLHVLYENAVQASAPRTPIITTLAHTDAGRLILEVTDDGPGVPAEIASRVFEPLTTARPGGRGLGLALARQIALVESEGGATFRVELLADS